MGYVITVPVQFYPIDDNNAACESAFAEHLKQLLQHVQQYTDHIHIVAPSMSAQAYELRKSYLTTLNRNTDNIHVTCAYPAEIGRLKYCMTKLLPVIRLLKPIIKNADIVHSGPSSNLFRPFEIIAIYLAARYHRPSIFVIDIDERDSAKMDYIAGHLSLKSYLLCKYLYNPFLSQQIKFAVKHCTLVLLKSQSLVADYGRGAAHVKNFLDTAHSPDAVISETKVREKIEHTDHTAFRLVYFGRLTEYKGIIDMIKATVSAKNQHQLNVQLTIIGEGEQKPQLQDLVNQLNAQAFIAFKNAMPYGEQLFQELYQHDALLAAPQRQDTPRSVFDAMSNGLITIAYDTYYYRDLISSGAVIVTPWLDIEAMAKAIVSLASNPQQRAEMITAAVNFARENTQDYWLDKRNRWLAECLNQQ